MSIRLVFIVTLYLYSFAASDDKVWIRNTNFDDPKNWKDGRIPCGKGKAIFPPSGGTLGISVILPSDVSVSELVLPPTGELLLPSNGILTITGGRAKPNCQNAEDAVFIAPAERRWVDPDNWRFPSHTVQSLAVPHVERLPCTYDTAEFPSGKSFHVLLPNSKINVGAILIDDKRVSAYEWKEFLTSEAGKRQFRSSTPSVSISGTVECTDSAGCSCGTDTLLTEVCTALTGRCKAPPCSHPIRPNGHCCDICGAVLTLVVNPGEFVETNLKSGLGAFLKSRSQLNIQSHVGRLRDGRVQIVLVEAGEYIGSTTKVVKELSELLQPNSKNEEIRLGIITISMKYAGPPLSGIGALGIMTILFVLCLIVAFLYLAYTRKWFSDITLPKPRIPNIRLWKSDGDGSSFGFARFDNESRSLAGGLEPGSDNRGRVELLPTIDPIRQAFDNPMYNAKTETLVEVAFPKGSSSSAEVAHENPVYEVLQQESLEKASLEKASLEKSEAIEKNEEEILSLQ